MKWKLPLLFLSLVLACSILPLLSNVKANAWSGNVSSSCSLENWDFRRVYETQMGHRIEPNDSFIVMKPSATQIYIFRATTATNTMEIFTQGTATSIRSLNGTSHNRLTYNVGSDGVISYNSQVFTTAVIANAVCIQYANGVQYTNYTGRIYETYKFDQPEHTIVNNYNTTNNTSGGSTVDPINSKNWWNPSILLGEALNSASTNQMNKAIYLLILASTTLFFGGLILFIVFKTVVWLLPKYWKKGKE